LHKENIGSSIGYKVAFMENDMLKELKEAVLERISPKPDERRLT
jgi:hypothetical protein